jgi:hypothetical protein
VAQVDRLRRALTFENVLVTVVAFVVFAGGTAFAAQQLGKKTVGAKQLKANAVTTAKIKKNAVTKAKIRNGSVDSGKVLDGSLTNADLNPAGVPFGHIVFTAHGTSSPGFAAFPSLAVIPLDNSNYSQEAGRDDFVSGTLDFSFNSACEPPRIAVAYALVDEANPLEPNDETFVALGEFIDEKTSGASNVRIHLSPIAYAGALQPAAAANHTLSLLAVGGCKTGAATASNATLQVVGVK